MTSRPDREREETASAANSVAVPGWTLTTLIGFLTFLLFVYAIHWVLLPFIIAGVIAYVCTPLIDLLSRYGPRTLMAIAVFLVLLAIAAGLALLGLPALIAESSQVLSDFGGTIKRLVQGVIGNRTVAFFGQPMDASQIAELIVSSARNWVKEGGNLVDLASWSFGAFFGFILTLVLLLYFVIGGQSIGSGLLWVVPPAQRDFVDHIWRRVDPVLKRYFIGVFVIVLFTSVAAYLGLGVILGIHQAVFLALMTGILEVIPIVGPAAAITLAGVVAVQQATGIGAIMGYAIYATALRLSIDQLLGPVILGKAARLHPTIVIFCFLTGGFLFGIAGVILAVPVALAIRVILTVLYDSPDRLSKEA